MRGTALLDRQPICQGRIATGCPFLQTLQAPSLGARCSLQLQQTRRPAWRREAACNGWRCRTHNQHAARASAGAAARPACRPANFMLYCAAADERVDRSHLVREPVAAQVLATLVCADIRSLALSTPSCSCLVDRYQHGHHDTPSDCRQRWRESSSSSVDPAAGRAAPAGRSGHDHAADLSLSRQHRGSRGAWRRSGAWQRLRRAQGETIHGGNQCNMFSAPSLISARGDGQMPALQQHVQLSCPAGCVSAHGEVRPMQSGRCAWSFAIHST
jgi:hypothetical protein